MKRKFLVFPMTVENSRVAVMLVAFVASMTFFIGQVYAAPPAVQTLSPADNATGVALTANLVITFDVATRAGTGTLTIKKTSDDSTVEIITVSGALLSGNGTTQLTLDPSATLTDSTSYYILWTANAFKNAGGEHVAAQTSTTYWNFTTVDLTAPTVSSVSPTDNATGVSTTTNLVLNFNETTRAGTGTLTIKKTSDDSTVETITVSGALLSGNGTTQLTLDPATTLADSTSYYIVWTANAFKDPSGNHVTVQTSTTYWNFTTAAAPESGGGGGAGWLTELRRQSGLNAQGQPISSSSSSSVVSEGAVSSSSSSVSISSSSSSSSSLFSSLASSVSSASSIATPAFGDVPKGSWFSAFVFRLVEAGIVEGYKDAKGNLMGVFRPANLVSRAEILKMALKAAGQDIDNTAIPRNRSAKGDWSASYVAVAEALRLSVYGISVDVREPATRGEVLQLIFELQFFGDASTDTHPFKDLAADHPYRKAISAAWKAGVVSGDTTSDGTLLFTVRPNDPVNRAEVSKILNLAIDTRP